MLSDTLPEESAGNPSGNAAPIPKIQSLADEENIDLASPALLTIPSPKGQYSSRGLSPVLVALDNMRSTIIIIQGFVGLAVSGLYMGWLLKTHVLPSERFSNMVEAIWIDHWPELICPH